MPNDTVTGLAYSLNGSNATITGFGTHPSSGVLNIPATVDGYAVVAIGAFSLESSGLTNISLPGSIITIDDHAFGSNSELTSIIFAGGYGGGHNLSAFNGCSITLLK